MRIAKFIAVSVLFVAAPLPLIACAAFAGGGWRDAFDAIARWLAFAPLYWWPVGAFLAFARGPAVARYAVGYALSIPLYFASLAIVYPAFGGAFHPLANVWIYLSATPQFFAMVALAQFVMARRAARWTLRGAAALFAAGLIAPAAIAASARLDGPKTRGGPVAIVGARIVDAAANRAIDGECVYVEGGRIAAIGVCTQHADWPRIDARGAYLVPGLIDVHTHLQSPVEVREGFAPGFFFASLLANYAPARRAYLESGVTTVRDLGGPARQSYAMRAAIEKHEMLGPRLFTSGRLVTSPHGHPVSTIWPAAIAREGAILAFDEKSLDDGLDRNFAAGPPDCVKLIHGTIGRAKEELSAALLTSGVAWARAHRLPSVVHAETATEVEDALRAGADEVEHTAYLDDAPPEFVALVAARHPYLDPTFGEYETSLELDNVAKPARDAMLEKKYAIVRELARDGARIVIGTDAPMVNYGTGFHDEIAWMLRAGFAPAEVLEMATVRNAECLGRGGELGRVAVGFRADLILVNGNPLLDPSVLRRPVWTMRDGEIVTRAERP